MAVDVRRWQVVLPVLAVVGVGFILLGVSLFRPRVDVISIIPTRTGSAEYCLTCHQGIEEISASHPIAEFGCVSCHGGEAQGLDENSAHTGMVRNPSALNVASAYCGECHGAPIYLVERSIQATYAGAITTVRRAFGLQQDDIAHFGSVAVDALQAFTVSESDPPHVQRFGENCLNCHLNAQPIAQDNYHRSTGCASCHVLYSGDGVYSGGDPTIATNEAGHSRTHQFTTAIPYTQCNHCHNRGNYDLRSMTFLERTDLPLPDGLSPEQQRAHDYYQPGTSFTRCEWELDCIDCHTSYEVMGDGQIYSSRSQAQYIQCSTCHGTLESPPLSTTIRIEQDIAMTRAALNPYVDLQVGDTIMSTERGEPLYHIQLENLTWYLTGKPTGTVYSLPLVTGSSCQQNGTDQSSSYCHQCHAYSLEGTP